jgi:hypothetical protein
VTDARPLPSAGPPFGAADVPAGSSAAVAPARPARFAGFQGSRADLRSALYTVAALAVAGLAAGGLWVWLAPRADYRVTKDGVQAIGAAPSNELFMSDDGVFVLILAGLGLLAGVAVWLNRRHRGPLVLLALATGMLVAGVLTWQVGEWAGPAPTQAELGDVGARVTTALSLGATAALAVGPFVAVLVYLVATALTSREDLGGDPAAPVDQPAAGPWRPPLPPVPPPAARN